MKNIISKILTVICLTAMVCCSNESLGTTGTKEEKKATVNINYNLCKMTAETQIMQTAQYDDKWAGAEITDHYYWYNPMIEDAPAYIEFKVTKDGEDAGYVMVSTTEQDFEVPEYRTEGKAMYECLQSKADSQDIKATRFSSFDYMAEVTNGRGESRRVFLGNIDYMNDTEGGRGDSAYEEYLSQYKAFRNKIGGIGGCKAELDKHYEMKKAEQESVSRGDPITYGDMHACIARPEWLPTYNQFVYKNGASGCAPTAAAIILAYYYRYHNKKAFFNTIPSLTFAGMTDNEKNVVRSLGSSSYMKTDYYTDTKGERVGATTMYDAWSGLYRFIADHGYNHWCIRYYWVDHNSDEAQYGYVNTFADWNTIYTEISENRPAILHYQDPAGAHSAVIYDLTINRNRTTGFVENVHCEIITGWGDGSEDIPARKTVYAGSLVFWEVLTCKMW